MLLPDVEKPTGGKVDEGYRGASRAEDGTGRAIRCRVSEEGGQWGKNAWRGRMGREGGTHAPLWEGMEAGDGRGSYARGPRGQRAGCALLSYPIGGEGEVEIEGEEASGFGLRSPAVRPQARRKDAPQVNLVRLRLPTAPVSTPTFGWRTYRDPAIGPPQKFSAKN